MTEKYFSKQALFKVLSGVSLQKENFKITTLVRYERPKLKKLEASGRWAQAVVFGDQEKQTRQKLEPRICWRNL